MSTPPLTRVCPNCGAPASSWARFCRECGTDLPAPGQLIFGEEPIADEALLAEDTPTVPWRAWHAILIRLLALVPTLIVPLVVLNATGWDCKPGEARPGTETGCDLLTIGTVAIDQIALFTCTMLWIRKRHGLGLSSLGFQRVSGQALKLGVGAGALGVLIAYGMLTALLRLFEAITGEPIETPKQIALNATPGALILVLLGLLVIVGAPIAEETFFRGFLYRGLRRWASPARAIVVSSVFFGLAHFQPLLIVATGLLGAVLAFVVERTNNLFSPIIAHALFNAVGFAVLVGSGEL